MKVSCYLILQGVRSWRSAPISKARVVGVRAGRPSLAKDEAAVRIELDVPVELFDPAKVSLLIEPKDAMLAAVQEPV